MERFVKPLDDDDFEDAVDIDGRPIKILKDGHRMRVPMHLMDAAKLQLHDGRGGPVGQRPGFAFTTDAATRDAKIKAFDEYRQSQMAAWQAPSTCGGSRDLVGQDAAPVSTADACAIKGAALTEYSEQICNAWRNVQ